MQISASIQCDCSNPLILTHPYPHENLHFSPNFHTFSIFQQQPTEMGVRIRRFSKCVKTPKNPPPPETPKKKTPYKHKFPAVTRIEKIMDGQKPYPQSCRRKIVFRSNDYGTGFQDQHDVQFPPHIPVQKMKDEVNLATYKNWSDYRDHSQRDHFKGRDKFTNKIVKVGSVVLVLFSIPVLMGQEIEEIILLLMFASFILAVLGVFNSFYTFSLLFPEFQIDDRTIKAVMGVLTRLNNTEKETHPNGPRFRWTCSEDCLWIAIEIFSLEEEGNVGSVRSAGGSVEEGSVIKEVSARFQTSRTNELMRDELGKPVPAEDQSEGFHIHVQDIED